MAPPAAALPLAAGSEAAGWLAAGSEAAGALGLGVAPPPHAATMRPMVARIARSRRKEWVIDTPPHPASLRATAVAAGLRLLSDWRTLGSFDDRCQGGVERFPQRTPSLARYDARATPRAAGAPDVRSRTTATDLPVGRGARPCARDRARRAVRRLRADRPEGPPGARAGGPARQDARRRDCRGPRPAGARLR